MWKAEEDFPRGGSRTKERKLPEFGKDGNQRKSVSSTLKIRDKAVQGKRKSESHKQVSSAKRKRTSEAPLFEGSFSQLLCPDMCVLACVKQAHSYSISVSLPGNITATIPITDISQAYSAQLQALAQAEDPELVEEVKPVEDLFKPGMLLVVKVKEIVDDKKTQKKQIHVASAPSQVYSQLPLREICNGMLLCSCVSSVEDHGYKMDLGIKGLQAFLPTQEAASFVQGSNDGEPLSVGQPLWCVVRVPEGEVAEERRVVKVTIDPKTVQDSLIQERSKMNALVPGINIKAVVEKVFPFGLQVKFNNFTGTIRSSQLSRSPMNFETGEEIAAKMLFINPNSKSIELTALPKLVKCDGSPLKLFGSLKFGDILDAKVRSVDPKIGLYLQLAPGVRGLCVLSQICDKTNTPDLSSGYEKGSVHKCRIMAFNPMETIALVTLKESVLKEKFLHISDLSPGDIVKGVVTEVMANGVVVKLSRSVYSFIPCTHLTDVPIKHPEKKFEAGMELKCRILKVDIEKSKVLLTHKKSLVKSKYPILTEYSQLKPYMELEGYIFAVSEKIVRVAFYNDVQGYVVQKDMSVETVQDATSMFYKGQVVRCRVVYFSAADKKLKLSFNLGERKQSVPKDIAEFEVTKSADVKVGQILEASIIRMESELFRVCLTDTKTQATLPFVHLSDYHELQELRRLSLKPGHILPRVIVFSNSHGIVVSLKESFLSAPEAKFVENFDELEIGMLLPAVVKNHQDYGIFVELAGGHTGLCPSRTVRHLQPTSLPELFHPGQSVVIRLSKIDTEKKRFLASLRLDDCFEGGFDDSLVLLRNYLMQRDEILKVIFAEKDDLSVYEEINVGDVVDITVSALYKKGILCDVTGGAKALVTKNHFGDIDPAVGGQYQAVVLFVDPLTPCVELTLDSRVVKAVSSRKENRHSEVKAGQKLKADILLIKADFVLMVLRGHGSGKLVYTPMKQHVNDVEPNTPFKVGAYTDVVIKEQVGEKLLAILKRHEPKDEQTEVDFKNMNKHAYKPGMMIDAKVKAVHNLQINIQLQNIHGRVHITEVTDSVNDGDFPLRSFKVGQNIKAKVIGLRDVKSQSYLPISNPKSNRTLLECSLKKSKLSKGATNLLHHKLEVKEGDEIQAFVCNVSPHKVWLQVSLTQQGSVDFFHLSDRSEVLNAAKNYFHIGQAVKATVLEIKEDDKLILSLTGASTEVTKGQEITGLISSIQPTGVMVKMAKGQQGFIPGPPGTARGVGEYIRCHVEKITEKGRCVLSLISDGATPTKNARKGKRKISLTEEPEKDKQQQKKKRKRSVQEEEGGDSGVDVPRELSESDDDVKPEIQIESAARLHIEGFSWGGDLPAEIKDEPVSEHDEDDDDDDDEDENAPREPSKSKKKRKRDEEKAIQEYERSQLEGETGPQTTNDLEKLVLQSPNSSVVWLRYIAFHAELGELEKARAVSERALSTISFREEQEKKNIWLAYLNLETMYGEVEDVKKLLQRAVSYNDPLEIYLKMCDIYVSAGKTEDAEQLYNVIIRKHKHHKEVWKAFGRFLFKSDRIQSARNLLQRCVSVLDKKDHVEVISRFANLEFTHGEPERGRTMFENLIASYPGRTDLWSVYVDMVAKAGDVGGARQLLERAVKQKLNTKKLSFLVQKYIKFEESHGTEDSVAAVKEMAVPLFSS